MVSNDIFAETMSLKKLRCRSLLSSCCVYFSYTVSKIGESESEAKSEAHCGDSDWFSAFVLTTAWQRS